MPIATLLLREEASASLATLVEKSQYRRPPLPEYDLQLNSCQLDLIARSKPESTSSDEGFESDIDTLSIVSSDGSFTPENKTTETDSANGSASSDSDTENASTVNEINISFSKESYNLVECVCYTDINFPSVLVFVIKQEALVFKFENLNILNSFYLNFTALKAVSNQKTYNKNAGTKFNLLQRTDCNGITHIEITREPEVGLFMSLNDGPSSIISLNTPESKTKENIYESRKLKNEFPANYKILSSSSENLLNHKLVNKKQNVETSTLRKVWNSAEDLLSSVPKRPERRKKLKGKAPLPPVQAPHPTSLPLNKLIATPDVMRGEYVRVNVNVDAIKDKDFIAKSQLKEKKLPTRTNLTTLFIPKTKTEHLWTNSVPRLLKKQRSRSETRCFTPMAYRYIDTAPNYAPMSSRFFGLSSKLRNFEEEQKTDYRWNSVGELSCNKSERSNLKSVIKKDEGKKKNDKKVTFSAYTTVQVV